MRPALGSTLMYACAAVFVVALFSLIWASLTQFASAPLAAGCASPCPEGCTLGPNFNNNAWCQLVYLLVWLVLDVVEAGRSLPLRLDGASAQRGKPSEKTPLRKAAMMPNPLGDALMGKREKARKP